MNGIGPYPLELEWKSGIRTLRELDIHDYDIVFITNKYCDCDLKQCKDANWQKLDLDYESKVGIHEYDIALIINIVVVIWSNAKMPINKSGISIKNRKSVDYMNNVKDFVRHASNFMDSSRKVRCPYKKCVNMNFERIGVV